MAYYVSVKGQRIKMVYMVALKGSVTYVHWVIGNRVTHSAD